MQGNLHTLCTKSISPIGMWSAREQVVNSLRKAILISELKAGERLVLDDLSARLGVSVTPARKALQSLEREGLVRLMPRKEAVVVGTDRKYATDYYVTRTILGSEAAAMACDVEDVTVLLGHLKRMEQAVEEERCQGYTDASYDLYKVIWILADSGRMERILKTLFIFSSLTRSTSPKGNALVSFGEHKEIMKVIQIGNKQDARKKMHTHTIRSFRNTLSKYEEQQEIVRFAV